MNAYIATGLAEGFIAGTEEEQIEAWQYLLDTGIVWQLQGSFGRLCKSMIEGGVLTPPPVPKSKPGFACEVFWSTASGTGSSTINARGYSTLHEVHAAIQRVFKTSQNWEGYELLNFGTCTRL